MVSGADSTIFQVTLSCVTHVFPQWLWDANHQSKFSLAHDCPAKGTLRHIISVSQLGPPADVEFASAAWSNTALSNTGATGLIGICMIGSNSFASEGLPCCLVCAELAARPKCSATILQSAKYAIIQMADIIRSYVFAKWLLSFSQLWHCSQLC